MSTDRVGFLVPTEVSEIGKSQGPVVWPCIVCLSNKGRTALPMPQLGVLNSSIRVGVVSSPVIAQLALGWSDKKLNRNTWLEMQHPPSKPHMTKKMPISQILWCGWCCAFLVT